MLVPRWGTGGRVSDRISFEHYALADITRGFCDDDFHGDTTLIAIRGKL